MPQQAPHGKRFEDYLEAIYLLEKEKGVARVRDLSRLLGVKPSTVVEHLEKLSREGLVVYEKREYIRLTEKGMELAKQIYEYHKVVRRFLKEILMLPEEIAEKDACYIEHGIHKDTIIRLKLFLEYFDKHFKEKEKFLEELKQYYTEHQ
ncbi:metal-dependent transcriptional regulator [Desulfurococcaceae archaeon MEX13E-LK6-19]|nr:metal-dependent transcriptional regulator [Desulfurococcaceae archaeon MEX13E-LK6-19]